MRFTAGITFNARAEELRDAGDRDHHAIEMRRFGFGVL